MDTDTFDVATYLDSNARMLNRTLERLREQVGAAALAQLILALNAGGMLRSTTTVALSGEASIHFDLLCLDGREVRLGHIQFDGGAVALN